MFVAFHLPPRPTLFPTRRSSDLGRAAIRRLPAAGARIPAATETEQPAGVVRAQPSGLRDRSSGPDAGAGGRDRKSTRLNSSHLVSSYAVVGLKEIVDDARVAALR